MYIWLLSSCCITSVSCILRRFTHLPKAIDKKVIEQGFIQFPWASDFKPNRILFCQMINKNKNYNVSLFWKTGKIIAQKENYEKRQWWFMKIKVFCNQTDMTLNSDQATNCLCHFSYHLFLICKKEIMRLHQIRNIGFHEKESFPGSSAGKEATCNAGNPS